MSGRRAATAGPRPVAARPDSRGPFDWCRPGDPEHARCKVAYRRTDGTWRVCSCPGHSPAEIDARKIALTPCTSPDVPAK